MSGHRETCKLVLLVTSLMSVAVVAAGEGATAARGHGLVDTVVLRTEPGGFRAASYAGPSLWLVRAGQVWRFDSKGEEHAYRLPEGLAAVDVWADGPSAVALGQLGRNRRLVRLADTGSILGQVEVDPSYHRVVPFGAGYVGHRIDSARRIEAVAPTGERRALCFEPSIDRATADGCRPAPVGGHLIGVDRGRVAYLIEDPYEVWLFDAGGGSHRLAVDDSEALPPEETSFPRREWLAVERLETIGRATRVAWSSGRILVGRTFRIHYELTVEVGGMPPGFRAVGYFNLIDVVDVVSGRVIERVDVAALQRGAQWIGLRGEELVLIGFRRRGAEQYLTFASAF